MHKDKQKMPDLLSMGRLGQVLSQLRDANAVILIQDQIYSLTHVLTGSQISLYSSEGSMEWLREVGVSPGTLLL